MNINSTPSFKARYADDLETRKILLQEILDGNGKSLLSSKVLLENLKNKDEISLQKNDEGYTVTNNNSGDSVFLDKETYSMPLSNYLYHKIASPDGVLHTQLFEKKLGKKDQRAMFEKGCRQQTEKIAEKEGLNTSVRTLYGLQSDILELKTKLRILENQIESLEAETEETPVIAIKQQNRKTIDDMKSQIEEIYPKLNALNAELKSQRQFEAAKYSSLILGQMPAGETSVGQSVAKR